MRHSYLFRQRRPAEQDSRIEGKGLRLSAIRMHSAAARQSMFDWFGARAWIAHGGKQTVGSVQIYHVVVDRPNFASYSSRGHRRCTLRPLYPSRPLNVSNALEQQPDTPNQSPFCSTDALWVLLGSGIIRRKAVMKEPNPCFIVQRGSHAIEDALLVAGPDGSMNQLHNLRLAQPMCFATSR